VNPAVYTPTGNPSSVKRPAVSVCATRTRSAGLELRDSSSQEEP
jgi:hypothetical protein